jgi:hypothetical protein
MKKKEFDPEDLIHEKQEGAGAILWACASILLLAFAVICFVFWQFCH